MSKLNDCTFDCGTPVLALNPVNQIKRLWRVFMCCSRRGAWAVTFCIRRRDASMSDPTILLIDGLTFRPPHPLTDAMRPGPRGLPLLVLLLLLIAFDNCTATIMLARGGGVGYRVVGYCCASVRTTATAHRSSRGLAFLAARPSHPRQALLLGSSRGRGRGAASRLSASTPSSELPRLDLVFDINKTILVRGRYH